MQSLGKKRLKAPSTKESLKMTYASDLAAGDTKSLGAMRPNLHLS